MTFRRSLATLVPAAALVLLSSAPVAYGQEIPSPTRAAELNAGTAHTGIGPSGYVGVGISAVTPEVAGTEAIEVAGVQLGAIDSGTQHTESTTGSPSRAAALNAGTASTGLGANGEVGAGIVGAQAGTEVAGVQLENGLTYEQNLRQWTPSGYRVTAGHIHMTSLTRELSARPEGNVEVAGVQLGDVDSDGDVDYAEGLRIHSSEGYRVSSSYVNTSAIARR